MLHFCSILVDTAELILLFYLLLYVARIHVTNIFINVMPQYIIEIIIDSMNYVCNKIPNNFGRGKLNCDETFRGKQDTLHYKTRGNLDKLYNKILLNVVNPA